MTELYSAKRRNFNGAHRAFMHHVAWGIVCIILISCVGGLWTYAQSLATQNMSLRQQLVALRKPAPTTCRVSGSWQANTTTVQDINKREYLVHTPSGFTQDAYYPIVLMYPGKGATAEAAQAAYGLDALPAIVIYPHPTISTDGFMAWQGAPYSSQSDDVAFTGAILKKTESDLCVDRTRVYAVGMSNGGGFASLLACKLADKFAAYATISGAMYEPYNDCTPPRPTPLLSVHGDLDPIVPYRGSIVRRLPAVETWASKRAAMNGCTVQTTQNQGITLAVTTWSGCKDNATVESIRVIGGGHAWGDVTNDTIWQFLSRFSR